MNEQRHRRETVPLLYVGDERREHAQRYRWPPAGAMHPPLFPLLPTVTNAAADVGVGDSAGEERGGHEREDDHDAHERATHPASRARHPGISGRHVSRVGRDRRHGVLPGPFHGGNALYLPAESRILQTEPLKLGEWGLVVVMHG